MTYKKNDTTKHVPSVLPNKNSIAKTVVTNHDQHDFTSTKNFLDAGTCASFNHKKEFTHIKDQLLRHIDICKQCFLKVKSCNYNKLLCSQNKSFFPKKLEL